MVGRQPLLRLLFELEHREVGHPNGPKGSRAVFRARVAFLRSDNRFRHRERTVTVGVLLCQLDAQVSRSRVDGDFALR